MSVKLLDIVVIAFRYYPNIYCLLQGSCFVCSSFPHTQKNKLESQPLKHLLEHFHSVLSTFYNNSSFWVVYYTSFQSDMLYIETLILLIYFHINYY